MDENVGKQVEKSKITSVNFHTTHQSFIARERAFKNRLKIQRHDKNIMKTLFKKDMKNYITPYNLAIAEKPLGKS